MENLLKSAEGYGPVLYRLASIYAVATAAASRDDRLGPAERNRLADRYAAAAVPVLRQVRQSGYFEAAQRIKQFKEDPDMQPLRNRKDFREFVAELTTDH